MDAVEFLKEYTRMCSKERCADCPVMDLLDEDQCCDGVDKRKPEELVTAVEQWSKEHPMVTNGQKVLELMPEEKTLVKKMLATKEVWINIDTDWWNAEYKGV